MDVFVARQPIFNRHKKIYAYELLFRSGESNDFPNIDGETATTSLLSSSFFTVGIDKIGAGKLVFINFTEDLLLNGTPLLFPPEKMMVEILEDVEPTPEIIDACKELKKKGYQLALDDFVYAKKFHELLQLSDIIKIDFRLTPLSEVEEMVGVLQQYGCKLLAEKVETHEEYTKALELGFDYFQGYFFSKPEVLKNKDLSSSQLSTMKLISEVNSADFDIDILVKYVSEDVSITYKLLTYINSAHFARVAPINSIRQAISFLGAKNFRSFVSLIATSKLADDKPNELIRSSIVRARFLELVGIELGRDGSQLFLLGLFSSIEAMLDQSLQNIIQKLSLSKDITAALVDRSGELFNFLRLVETYEAGNWVSFQYTLKKIQLADTKVSDFYIDALALADSFQQI